jgi:hypothetical protein
MAIWSEEDGSVIGYMCKVDYECELGAAAGGNVVYPTVEDLKERRRCVDECGIVKVAVSLVEVVQEENYGDYD